MHPCTPVPKPRMPAPSSHRRPKRTPTQACEKTCENLRRSPLQVRATTFTPTIDTDGGRQVRGHLDVRRASKHEPDNTFH